MKKEKKKKRRFLTRKHAWVLYDLGRSSGWRFDTKSQPTHRALYRLERRKFVKRVEYMNGIFWEITKSGEKWLETQKEVIKQGLKNV